MRSKASDSSRSAGFAGSSLPSENPLSSSVNEAPALPAPLPGFADEHRREIVRFYLWLRVGFLLVSVAILILVPQQLNPNHTSVLKGQLWQAWLLFSVWTVPLWLVYLSTRGLKGDRLIFTDYLISFSILPDSAALYLAASVTGGTAGLVYRSVYFLIAVHSYHFSTMRPTAKLSTPRARLLPLGIGALVTVLCGMGIFCSLARPETPWTIRILEGGLQAITAVAFSVVRWSDLARAQRLATSLESLRAAEYALQRQKQVESRLLEAMQGVSSIGRLSDESHLDQKLRELAREIGQNVGSEYCAIGLVRDNRLDIVARHASFPITQKKKSVLRSLVSRPAPPRLVSSLLAQTRPFRWNSKDGLDLIDLSDDELKGLKIALDRTAIRRFRDFVLPSRSIRHVLVATFYSQDDESRPLGYVLLLNDMPEGTLSESGFSARDEERLGTIASQLAVAISNFERHRADMARAEHEAFLSSLVLTHDLDELFDRVLGHLNQEYKSRVASVWLATEDGFGSHEETLRIVLRSVMVAEQPGARTSKKSLEDLLKRLNIFKPDECYIGRFFRDHEPPAVTYEEDMRKVTDSWSSCVEQMGTSHLIAIPICRYGPVPAVEAGTDTFAQPPLSGVVCLRPLNPFVLTNERREALERFADYLAVLIDQVRFRQWYKQIEILKNQLPALQSSDLSEFYPRVVGLVRDTLSAEACSLFTVDTDGALVLKATTATKAIRVTPDGTRHELSTANYVDKAVYPAGEQSITKTIAEVGKTTLIYDVHRSGKMSKFFMEMTPTFTHESLIGAPIFHTDGTLLGVLRCINRKKAGALLPVFVTGDREFLDLIMGIMARFIENAEASESKRDFLRQLAHELATPLAALRDQIDFLEDIQTKPWKVRDSEEQFGYLHEQADFIQYLVTDIQYQFGKGAAIRTRFDFSRAVDLKPTIERIKKLLLATARMDRQIDIVTGTTRMPLLHVDPRRMEQVIFNLVQNAVKYSRKGVGPIFISYDLVTEPDLATGRPVSWHRLSFQDWGVGVRKSDRQFIFDEYRRGTNIEGAPSGTGLGLAVTKRIVEAHGGKVSVISLGSPTIFAVDLPEYLMRRPPSDSTPID
jgi:signal transduction histidine kinase